MKKNFALILPVILALAILPAFAQQTLQIVNDASPSWSDNDVYILFTANPASVTANGVPISGVRDASLPIGTVTTSTTANGSALVSTSFSGDTLPATPFPIQFLSGNNSTPVGNSTAAPVFQVTAFSDGNFTVNGTLLPMTNTDQFVVGAYSQQLSSLPVVGNLTSSLSGRTQKIYQVTLGNNFAAGVVFVSYGAPLTYTNASPSPSQTQTLFQIFEVTTANGAGATTSDLTYIDAYGFPLQIESVYTSNSTSSDRRTFYFSGNSVVSDLDSIGTLTTNSTILRLGPGQFASANNGNPSPFPSFSEYLQSVLTSDQTQTIAGVQAFGVPNPPTVYGVTVVGGYTQTYSYNATLSADAGGNFTYTLTPFGNNTNTINGTVPPYFPPIQNVSSLTVNLPADSLNETIYGCTLTSQSFQVNVSGNQSLTPVTFSGNFVVSSASNNSIVSTDTSLVQLAVTQLGGTWLNFLTGSLAGSAPVPINSGTLASNNATISLVNALPAAPQAGDRFEILFQVTSATNTTSSFTTTQLGSNNLNFLTGNITFVQCSGLSSNNTNQTVSIAAVDSLGNIRLQNALNTAPVAGDIFRISAPAQDVQTQLYTNSGFAWVAADVMSALNLGFIGGTAGDSSTEWFGQFPQKFPYGLARPVPDDGFYNPWGAYFYNASDGYAFAFSDRIQPSPLLSTDPTSQSLRLTILPHDQIDAPLVTATTTNSSMSLTWTPQNGVAYSVATQPSLPTGGNITVNSANGTAQLTGLPPGTPFEIIVTGAKGNQTSYTLPQIFSTNGTATPVAGTPFFQIQFIWAGGGLAPLDVSRYNVRLNGQMLTWLTTNPLSATANSIQAAGSNGTNLYVIDFIDTLNGNQTVMQSVLQMDLSAVSATEFTVNGTPTVLGSSGQVALNPSGNQTYHIPQGNLSPLVVAINFTPTATKQYAPVVLPDPSPAPTPSVPSLKISPLSINLNSTTVGTPSAAYSFTVSGKYLKGNVNITAPSGFQISTELASNYSTAVSLSPGNGILSPATVFVRMPANTVGTKSGKVMVKSSGAATQSLAVQGTVNPAKSAALIPSPTSLSKFTANSPTPSKSKSFTVKSISINQNILVTAPTNFQVAPNNGNGFGSSLTLPAKGGVINVRIAPNAPIGTVSGSVALQSGNTTAAVTLSGTVNPAPTPKPSPTPSPTPTPTPPPGVQLSFTPSVVHVPSTTVGTPSSAGMFQVEGSGLSGSVVVDGDNPNFQLSLSASGPFSADSVILTPTSGNLSVSVYVRTSGSTQGNFTEDIIGLGGGGAFAYGTVTGSVAPAQERTLAFLPTSLSGFQTTQGTPSTWKLVELSGSGFPSKTPITIEAPMGFQVASKPAGPWVKSISTNTNQFPMPIYIRLSGNQAGFLPDYSFSGSIYAYGGGVDASAVVSGLTYPPVSLGASPTTLARFNTTRGVSSAAQSVMFGPSAPCFYTGPISITAPTGYEVSLDGINYTPSLNYTVSESVNGQQWVEEFFIRISAKASKGKANGVATLTTPGIKSPVQIKISGKVN